jgi:hypothetical protein
MHLKQCRRCGEIYRTESRTGKVCKNCMHPSYKKRYDNGGKQNG